VFDARHHQREGPCVARADVGLKDQLLELPIVVRVHRLDKQVFLRLVVTDVELAHIVHRQQPLQLRRAQDNGLRRSCKVDGVAHRDVPDRCGRREVDGPREEQGEGD
jgi:hypothetical protein